MSLLVIVIPAIVMFLLLAAVFVAKVAVAELVSSERSSRPCLPTSVAFVLTSSEVALRVASYARALAVMPDTVSSFAVMLAVVVGCVST